MFVYQKHLPNRVDAKRLAKRAFSALKQGRSALGGEGGAGGRVGEVGGDLRDGAGGDDAVAVAGRDVAVEHRVVLHEDDDGRADRRRDVHRPRVVRDEDGDARGGRGELRDGQAVEDGGRGGEFREGVADELALLRP